MKPIIKFKRLSHGADLPLPVYATEGAAGLDICAAADTKLMVGRRSAIPTGFAVELQPGWELQVRPRSGLAIKHGLTVLNTPGTIDEDYRGEIMVILANLGLTLQTISRGERIAQLVPAPVYRASVVEVEELTETARNTGGFGSTGA